MSDKKQNVRFIRKNGRVIPIKTVTKDQKNLRKNMKNKNTADFYWKAEHHRKEARSRRKTAPFGAAVSGSISLAALGGGAMSLAEGGKSGIAGAALGLGIAAYSATGIAQSLKNKKMYAEIENDTSELQTNVVREEMRRQGYKNDGNAKSFDSAMTKAVQNINKSPYRHNFSLKTKNDIMDVYEGARR